MSDHSATNAMSEGGKVPPEDTKYGRCEATNREGDQCGQPATGHHGKCYYHGGAVSEANTVHDLRKPYLTDPQRRLYDDISGYEPHELILEEFHMTKTRLLDASRKEGGLAGEDLARAILADIPDDSVTENSIEALAQVIEISQSTLERLVGHLIQLSKEYRKWTEGETITVEGETDLSDEAKESLDRLSDSLEDVYGDA